MNSEKKISAIAAVAAVSKKTTSKPNRIVKAPLKVQTGQNTKAPIAVLQGQDITIAANNTASKQPIPTATEKKSTTHSADISNSTEDIKKELQAIYQNMSDYSATYIGSLCNLVWSKKTNLNPWHYTSLSWQAGRMTSQFWMQCHWEALRAVCKTSPFMHADHAKDKQ